MRLALRHLARSPGFTAAALATLALGIGVNTTAFTALNRLLLQALPFREPDRLVQIWGTSPRDGFQGVSPGDYFDLHDGNSVFEDVTAYVPYGSNSLAEPGQPAVYVPTMHSGANFFRMFGIQTQLGRTFTDDEVAHLVDVTLVSNYYWREHFGADPKILGRTVRLDGKITTIVGVLPARLDDPTLFGRRITFWTLDPTRINFGLRYLTWYRLAARLKPGVTLQQAQANVTAIARRLAHDFPKTNGQRGFRVAPYPPNNMGEVGSEMTWLVMVLSGLVLVIACVNLANLQLVRTTRRSHEIAIRLALGSSRLRIVAMLLEESFLLSIGGGLLALLVGKWSNIYVAKFFAIDMPLDLRVIGFTLAAAALTGAVFGLIPAWMAAREDVGATLKSAGRGSTSGRGRHWFRQSLVVAELVLALTVLSGAAYFVSGIYKITHQDLGWTVDHTLLGEITLDHDHFGEQGDPRSAVFGDRLKEVIEAIPGVKTAVTGEGFPAYGGGDTAYRLEGEPAPEPGKEAYANSINVGPGYLGVYGIPIVKGRDFNGRDRPGSPPVVLVNESMARKCWPGEDPIGKRIGGTDPANPNWAEVVGVMKDFHGVYDFIAGNNRELKMYRPWAQNSHRFVTFHVRTVGPPEALEESIKRAVAAIAPDFALSDLSPGTTVVEDNLAYFSFLRKALLELSALGLLLSAVGIYGVVATLVAERTKEIGIRMALGAQSGTLIWLFLKNGLLLSMVGAAIGGGAAIALVRILTRMLPFLPGFNLWIIAPVALFLVAVSLVSCWLPARRSARTSPTVSLRTE